MKIEVYSDMVCPWCRIGKKNMSDALAEWERETGERIDVRYRAFELDPSLPPEGKPFEQAMGPKFGGADKILPMLQRVTEAGAAVGVTFRFDNVKRMPNTFLAHRVTALLPAAAQVEWVDRVMTAYFEEGRDIAQRDVLLELAAALGHDKAALAARLDADEGTDEVRRDLDNARAMGISGVPFFILDGKYALSGAYPAAQFVAAFSKIAQESN